MHGPPIDAPPAPALARIIRERAGLVGVLAPGPAPDARIFGGTPHAGFTPNDGPRVVLDNGMLRAGSRTVRPSFFM